MVIPIAIGRNLAVLLIIPVCDVFVMLDFKSLNFLIISFSMFKNLTKLSKLFE
jgi:hypothetical protein